MATLRLVPKPEAGIRKWVVHLSGRISNATWDRSVSSNNVYGAAGEHRVVRLVSLGSRKCVKASKRGKKSFVRRPQSSIKKDMTALRFPISCEPLVCKKVGFTGTLKAKKSLRETPSTTLGKLQWMPASKEQRRSRIPLIVSNKSCGTFATGVPDWCRVAARC